MGWGWRQIFVYIRSEITWIWNLLVKQNKNVLKCVDFWDFKLIWIPFTYQPPNIVSHHIPVICFLVTKAKFEEKNKSLLSTLVCLCFIASLYGLFDATPPLSLIYIYIYIYYICSLAKWVECLPIDRETGVQSLVKSYQRLKKWYLIPPCLMLSTIRYISRVKWSNPSKGVASSPTPLCSNKMKKEPSCCPQLWSPTLLFIYLLAKSL